MEVKQFRDNFYILDDGRVRQFLITGEKDALLIDAGFEDSHVYDAVRTVTDLPVHVIMTHGDMDHSGGLKDFGSCRIHRKDRDLIPEGIHAENLAEGDIFTCGGYCFETIEIPGHTYGSVAFFDREKGILLPGDSVQRGGPIFMFGNSRNLDLYIESQKKLCGIADEVRIVLPCHHDCPIGPEYIRYNLEDAISLKNGELSGEPHSFFPCCSYRGRWSEFYYNEKK